MKDIDNHVVVRWASEWKEIARQLNMEEYLIRNIDHDYPNNCVECWVIGWSRTNILHGRNWLMH